MSDPVAAAVAIWRAARAAEGRAPDPARIDRVRAKAAAPDATLVVVGTDGVQAMGLAEPFHEDRGRGPSVPGWAHVSMVFVSPAHRRAGLGTEVLRRLHAETGARCLSLWTRESNAAARGLYLATGFRPTDELDEPPGLGLTRRWVRSEVS